MYKNTWDYYTKGKTVFFYVKKNVSIQLIEKTTHLQSYLTITTITCWLFTQTEDPSKYLLFV